MPSQPITPVSALSSPMRSTIEQILPFLRQKRKFVLTTHVNPDGDGLGCEIALAEWLAKTGKTVHIVNYSATPSMYRFLDQNLQIRKYEETRDARALAEADVIVVLDMNHPERLRAMQHAVIASPATRICIDHHPDPADFAHHYVIDEEATSTGEIVYRMLRELEGERLPPLSAAALYCAIMTDTGSFRYPRVDPEVHRIVAHLIECGADPVVIYAHVYEQWTVGRTRLLGETLASLKTEHNGKLAHITVTQELLGRTGTSEVDTDNFTTYPMSVAGVVIGILFLELKDGVKMSLRSKGNIAINELAQIFGGNGHKNAAGARLENVSIDTLREQVVRSASAFLLK